MTPQEVGNQLAKLKDFQLRTVEHVFRRFFRDENPTRRFLVADEVGLGKTMVARGVIAKTIAELIEQGIPRIDVIYVCSNAAIAQQNLARLNVLGQKETAFATRLTLLPQELSKLDANRVNFISFTPGTTFDLKSRAGTIAERVLLYRMLIESWSDSATPLRNLLQGPAGAKSWDAHLKYGLRADAPPIDERTNQLFLAAAKEKSERLNEALERFARRRENVPAVDLELRYQVIGELRQLLARVCVDRLEPDLIILDEFQRFRELLNGDSEAGELARLLFEHKDARLLLLSATPYQMYTQSGEDDDHHRDFVATVRFLLDRDQGSVSQLAEHLANFRRGLLQRTTESERLTRARDGIETCLRRIMTRTERVRRTTQRDAMLTERLFARAPEARDIEEYVALDRLARSVEAGDVIDYWKSAPHLLSCMENYELKQKLLKRRKTNKTSDEATREAFSAAAGYQVTAEQVQAYSPIEPGNARLRSLMGQTLDAGAWRLLWLPASLPYIEPSGPYAGLGDSARTKGLVFSSWNVAPKAVATMLSYEAERRMLEGTPPIAYERLHDARKPLLTFRLDRDRRPAGMPLLALLYPSATLIQHVDTLNLALDIGDGQPAPLVAMRARIGTQIKPLLDQLVRELGDPDDNGVDKRWYWAALPLLDKKHASNVIDWLESTEGWSRAIRGELDAEDEATSLEDEEAESQDESSEPQEHSTSGLEHHMAFLVQVVRGEVRLGRPPEDLLEVVADLALASPAVCAGRALLRVSKLSSAWDEHLLSNATRVARGFRTLFNQPETISLLRGAEEDESTPYWRKVLDYCVDGNLQAVLDEYAHQLVEATGKLDAPPDETAEALASAIVASLTPRSAQLQLDQLRLEGKAIETTPIRIRCRYAMRFGDVREESGAIARADTIRQAFNSPFRPFVLASTSVGQEGLDFHSYCHAVYHWNLPSNPVDLEQREGRVHRYKSHAVRRNLARHFGLEALRHRWSGEGDPWARLFELGAEQRQPGENELVPYWIFETEGGVKVERRVPLMPLSREQGQLEQLKRHLALYRLAFGQPRQEDLIACLEKQGDLTAEQVDDWRIRLEP